MKIKYRDENITADVIGILITLFFVFIAIAVALNDEYDSVYAPTGLTHMPVTTGIIVIPIITGIVTAISLMRTLGFIKKRKYLTEKGTKCHGKVTRVMKYNDTTDSKQHRYYLEVKYFSQVIGKEITIYTPFVVRNFADKDNMKCTIYECSNHKKKIMSRKTGLFSMNIELDRENFDDRVAYVVDTLDDAEPYKASKAEKVVGVVCVAIFIIMFCFALKK